VGARKGAKMRPVPPPYRPLRGAEPPHFVDRGSDDDLSAAGLVAGIVDACHNGPSDPRFHRLVTAGAAMGKTALLRAACRGAEEHLGWSSAFHRCRRKERALAAVASRVVSRVKLRWPVAGALLLPAEGTSPWERARRVLEMYGQLAAAVEEGLLVALDDVDFLSAAEAESLGYLAHALARERLPVALLMTASPWLGARFQKAGNFSWTVWHTELVPFEPSEAREAIVVPAAERGVEYDDRALELACRQAAGSPLEVQRIGFSSWAAARGRRRVGVAEVQAALTAPPLMALSPAVRARGGGRSRPVGLPA
jgi:hypothetical protein